MSQVCEPQLEGLLLSEGKTIEKAFKDKEIHQRGPLKYKQSFAKQKEKGMVFKKERRWVDWNPPQVV